MNNTYDSNFKISTRAMNLNNCHPSIKRDRKWFISFAMTHGLFTFVFLIVLYNIICINMKNNSFDDACRNGVLAIVYLVISFHHFLMFWKQKIIVSLLEAMQSDYFNAKYLSDSEQKIMVKYVERGVYVCKQWLVIAVWGGCIFPIKNIYLLSFNWAKGDPKLIPMIDLEYPPIVYEYMSETTVFIGSYAILLFYAIYAGIMYTAFVPLGPILMMHACGQLEIVEYKIKNIFEGNLENAENKLKDIIRRLQYIYWFVDQILLTFQIIYEFTLRGTTLLLPVTVYEVLEAFHKGDLPLEFISFIIGGILISSTPCYYSDLLMEKGEKVRIAMYTCGWECVPDPRIRSTIIIIMVRALQPVAIRTLFRTVCLETLADLLQQSYALFNLMNSMWS